MKESGDPQLVIRKDAIFQKLCDIFDIDEKQTQFYVWSFDSKEPNHRGHTATLYVSVNIHMEAYLNILS